MSDFFSSGWSVFIAVSTVVSLVACLALLVFASRRTKMADDNSTGHVFDGDLVEMNNPMPMWWVVLFVLTVIFAWAWSRRNQSRFDEAARIPFAGERGERS